MVVFNLWVRDLVYHEWGRPEAGGYRIGGSTSCGVALTATRLYHLMPRRLAERIARPCSRCMVALRAAGQET